MSDLTPEQEVMLIQYHLARIACLDAGFDPFHHPAPQ